MNNTIQSHRAFGMALQRPFSPQVRECTIEAWPNAQEADDLTAAIEEIDRKQKGNKLFDVVPSTEITHYGSGDKIEFVAQVVRKDDGKIAKTFTGRGAKGIIEALRNAGSRASLMEAMEIKPSKLSWLKFLGR